MRKTIFYSLFSTLFLLTSCSMFEIDNYDEPAETIWGEVVDEATGKRVLTDQGSEGIRVRLTELSWGDNVQHIRLLLHDGRYVPEYKDFQG